MAKKQYTGPDEHVSTDQTSNEQPVVESTPSSYPKYKYHSSGQNIVVNNAEDEANLGDEWQDSPAAFEEQGEPATEGQVE
jgi:hypothetical protein